MRRSILFLLACTLLAQTPKGPSGDAPPAFVKSGGWKALLNGKDLAGWVGENDKPHQWFTARSVTAEGKVLKAEPAPAGIIVNGPGGKTGNLVTTQKHGDVELYVEFMVPQGSNSGVYLQGLYEIQVFDSYGTAKPGTGDGGAIYHRWIDNKPVGGSAPKVNAQLPPGQWQSFHAWFRAPRFDVNGKKTDNARFVKVLHNGVLVQEDVEVEGGTRAHMNIPEAPVNPLMIQGDHGPVAYRNMYMRPYKP
jgi:hypothetical protein